MTKKPSIPPKDDAWDDSHASEGASHESPRADIDGEEWELDGDWRGIEQMLARLEAVSPGRTVAELVSSPAEKAHLPLPAPRSNWLVGSTLGVGLAVFACGAILIVWSYAGNRPDLLSTGLPLTIIGQFSLSVGLLLQLDHLGQQNRAACRALQELNERVHQRDLAVANRHRGAA